MRAGWPRPWTWALALAAGCSENGIRPHGGDDDDDATGPGGTVPADPITLTTAAAFDPLYDATTLTVITADAGAPVSLTVYGPDDTEVFSVDVTTDGKGYVAVRWDGADPSEDARLRPGLYHAVAALGDGQSDDGDVAVVRVGFDGAWLEGDDGVTATREPLYWPLERRLGDEADPVAVLDRIDDGRVPFDFDAVPASPMAARPATAEPAAFVYDSRPILTLSVAEHGGTGGPTGLDLAEVTLSVDGWTVLSGEGLAPGATVVLQRDAPLGDTVGVTAESLTLRFEVDGATIGRQALPLRVYRLLDRSQFTGDDPKYRPWSPVVEQALVAIDGTAPEPGAVVDALVDFVYFDLGLSYDTRSGASAYSEYGFGFTNPHFLLSDFLTRRFGAVINCSDAGNILGAYANMVGARLDHLILSPGFDLNYIQAIGYTEHTTCPFGPGGCGFSYHAVTTLPGSNAVWDATLALDGDADPGRTPNVDLMVQTIPGDEYLDRLVRAGNPQYQNETQETLQ